MTRESIAVVALLMVGNLPCIRAANAADPGSGTLLFENSDFSAGDFTNWKVQGKAFERGPTTNPVVPQSDPTGSLEEERRVNWKSKPEYYRQRELTGHEGREFANSYHPERLDKTTGRLLSQPFAIQDAGISFLVAGGQQPRPGGLAVNLLVGGKAVRQATPRDGDFQRCHFDVRNLKGQQAQIEIVDRETLYGGWIAVADIRGENDLQGNWIVDKSNPVVRQVSVSRQIDCNAKYLNIPAAGGFPEDAIELRVDGRVVQEICMAVADGPAPEFWQFIDLSLWQGRQATLRLRGWSSADDPLAGVVVEDRIRGLDNLFDEKHRPQFHFTPIQGWNNDVNGTVYYDGEYHLFYQYDPSRSGAIGRNMHWGHAVSTDFFHWKHLPIALGVTPERGQNYSGSAVVDFNNSAGLQKGDEKTLIAFYTRRKPWVFKQWDYDTIRSDQCIAYSNDRGRTWIHLEEPVLPCITLRNRDPKVFWHEPSRKWIMVVYISRDVRDRDRDGYCFYGSTNLRDWQEASLVTGGHECPDFFELEVDGRADEKKWVLVNGSGDYRIGEFDGEQFIAEASGRSAFGPLSATQTFAQAPDDGRRRVQMNWFHIFGSNRRHLVDKLGMPFLQLLSLPVELTLRTTDEGIRMFVNPAREIASLQSERRRWPDKELPPGTLWAADVPWELYDVQLTFDLGTARKLAVRTRGIEITYDVAKEVLALEKLEGGRTYRAKVRPQKGTLKLRVLLDRCSVDLFANEGQVYLMGGAWPDRNQPALECLAEGGSAAVKDIEFCRLKSVWKKQ